MNEYMKVANDMAKSATEKKEGGPFGAAIVDSEGNIVATGNNKVLLEKDPTCHAEITAIRNACKKLDTYDLSGMTLYTSCEPCPMCLSAIIWANIKDVYYACTKDDAAELGFRDDMIYNYLKNKDESIVKLKQIDRDECIETFRKYKDVIY